MGQRRAFPAVSWAAVVLLLGGLPGACRSDALGVGTGTAFVEQNIDPLPRKSADLLFVVDDSAGMGAKQQALVRAFPALLAALRSSPDGLPDLRVGVASTSLGAPGSHLAECAQSDRGLLVAPPAGCPAAPQGRFLALLDGGTRTNFSGDPAAAFACLVAALGTEGCGFAQPLEAARRALGPDQPVENQGFRRPDALLAVVVLADDDDCSVPADSDLFEPATTRYGPQDAFRCHEFGDLCGGKPPPRSPTAASLADCRPAEAAGKLTPVSQLSTSFQSFAPPDQTVVMVLAGPATPYQVGGTDAAPALVPSCNTASGPAAPSLRLAAFAAAFGAEGLFASACDADLSPALTELGHGLTRRLGSACLTAPPVQLATGDGTPDCWLTEQAAGLGPEVPVPVCTSGGPRPCWTAVANPTHCLASGYEARVDRGETAPLPGTVDTLRCWTCQAPDDPRCR